MFISFFLIILMFLLLVNGKEAFLSAQTGLLLWFETLVPTLFPFMLCTKYLIITMMHSNGSAPGVFTVLAGMICGYPMGAKTAADFVEDGVFSVEEGKRILFICSHPGPMFLIGFMYPRLSSSIPVWCFLLSLYLPMIPAYFLSHILFPPCTHDKIHMKRPPSATYHNISYDFENIFLECCKIMLLIGGYVMIFTVFSRSIAALDIIPKTVQCLICGLMEMTSGIEIQYFHLHGLIRDMLMIFTVLFSGCSGIFQVASVIKKAGLSVRLYSVSRLLYAGTAVFFYYIINYMYQSLIP